jgi:major membrane immunogen (membrane-anchored lipoprotein)
MRIKDIVSYRAGVALLCALLMGCSDPGDTVDRAQQVADGYYQALKNKDFEKAAGYFMNTKVEPRSQWLEQLRDYNNKLGDLQSHELIDKVVSTVYSGTRYTLRYKTKYSKFPANETLILFDGVSTFGGGNGNVLQIESLIIRSKGL